MHLFDTLVNAPVAISSAVLAGGAFAYASCRVRTTLPPNRRPMLGMSAGFVFAAQMLNFPTPVGASGHLLGAAMAAILVGPSAAVIAMSAVVVLQCFLFADGGVSALGANVFNMAVVGVVVGYGVFQTATAIVGEKWTGISAGLAGWFSVVAASAFCAGQIALSGHGSPRVIFTGMLGLHAVIGLGEAIVTGMVISAMKRARPELLAANDATQSRLRPAVVFGVLLALGLAIFVSPFACPWPDGLEEVVSRAGIDPNSIHPIWSGLMPDYHWGSTSSTAVAGAIGTVLVFLLGWGVVKLLGRKRDAAPAPDSSELEATTSR